jgi:hypothetical protein
MYKIVITDPATGKVFNPNGTPFRHDKHRAYFEELFPSLERAKTYCRAIVRRYPDMCCSIFDENKIEVEKYVDSEWLKQKAEEKRAWISIHAKEQRRQGLFYLGFLLAYSFVVTGSAVLLTWGGFNIWVALLVSGLIAILAGFIMGIRF